MSVRIQERLSIEGIDNRWENWRRAVKRGEWIDSLTTVETENVLSRLPLCCQRRKDVMKARRETEHDDRIEIR